MRRAVTFAQEVEQVRRQPVLLRGEDNVWFAIVFDQPGTRHPFRHHMARASIGTVLSAVPWMTSDISGAPV